MSNRKHILTIHDESIGNIRIEKVESGGLVFLFEKGRGWMFATLADAQHPEHEIRFGYCYNDSEV